MFLVQVPVDFTAAVRHLKQFLQPSAFDDETLILKTILSEGFSGGVVRPWAAHAQRGPITTVVGYSQAGADQLNKRRALALPSVQDAVGQALTASLPPLASGERYRFSIRLVPTVRITKSETRRYGERLSRATMSTGTISGRDCRVRPSRRAASSSFACARSCGLETTGRSRKRQCPRQCLRAS